MKFESFAKIIQHFHFWENVHENQITGVRTHENFRNFFTAFAKHSIFFQAVVPICSCLTHMFAKTFVKTNSSAKSVTNVFFYIIKHLLIAQHYHAVYSTIIRETFFCLFVLLIITGMERGNSCIVKWTLKCVNFSIISKNVPFRPMTVQVTNSALVEDENG